MKEKNFLGLEFKPIELQDWKVLKPFLKEHPPLLSAYSFPSLFARVSYAHHWTLFNEDTLLISVWIDSLKQYHLMEPIGLFSQESQNGLLRLMQKNTYPVKIYRISDGFIKKQNKFCSLFLSEEDRKYANYLHKAENLAYLKGGDYEKKRNLISQAEDLYSWKVEKMDEKHHPCCPDILKNVGKKKEKSQGLQNELKSLDIMLKNFDALHLKGICLIVNDQPAAFSIYGELNSATADIYFEKADIKFKGLYQLINRETAKAALEDKYTLINREEDLGLEGLRQAKLSYHPTELIPSHTLTLKPL